MNTYEALTSDYENYFYKKFQSGKLNLSYHAMERLERFNKPEDVRELFNQFDAKDWVVTGRDSGYYSGTLCIEHTSLNIIAVVSAVYKHVLTFYPKNPFLGLGKPE